MFLFDATEGNDSSCFQICSTKSVASAHNRTNAISHMPKVQDKGTETARNLEWSP